MMTITYNARLWVDLREELADKEILSFSLGYDDKLYVLALPKEYFEGLSKSNRRLPLHSKKPYDFVVFVADSTAVHSYHIPKQKQLYHFVQPLTDDELLLVCSRTRKVKENARVFTEDSTLRRSFSLGDAIESTQTTSTGEIWTSYFDEYLIQDLHGLHRWDRHGNEVYRYQPVAGLNSIDFIADCYAMNVVSDDTIWIYYYTDFPLVKIIDDEIVDYWQSSIYGSHWFAVHNNHIVFVGSYDDKLFHHFEILPNHEIKHIQTFDLKQKGWFTTRGKTIVICEGNQFYRFDVPELLRKHNRR